MKYIFFPLLLLQLLWSCTSTEVETKREFDISENFLDDTKYILTQRRTGKTFVYYRAEKEIDIESLRSYGAFLVDKNRVYRFYDISDYTLIFELNGADRQSFRTLGNSMYGKDTFHVFHSRNGVMDSADPATFHVVQIDNQCYGRDKNHYYFWSAILTDTDRDHEILEELRAKFDKK